MKVSCVEESFQQPPHVVTAPSCLRMRSKYLLVIVWMGLGLFPFILQVRSFVHFVTPHKVSLRLIVPANSVKENIDIERRCPAKELFVANIYWNLVATHYFTVDNGRLCHFVIPQYNLHGFYLLGTKKTKPSPTTQENCENDSFSLDYYFYHGSFGYYAFYEEGTGSYCSKDKNLYVTIRGLGTFDSNGAALAADQATTEYRRSYWYGLLGSLWIAYRYCVLRRSYVLCMRHSARCENAHHTIRLSDAMVYVQESMRLSAHTASNYHRLMLLYILVEGVMSELFMLIALEGLMGHLQYVSLGYNLSGLMSMLFEMVESLTCLTERTRCLLKRLLFNHETLMIGELICAAAMQKYITSVNRTGLKDTHTEAIIVSYYAWSLIGHGVIVLGCVITLACIRALGAVAFVRYQFGSFAALTAPCCVDTIMGERCKLIMLAGYAYENGKLYYKPGTLAAFGILRLVEENDSEYLAIHQLNWVSPKQDLFVVGVVSTQRVIPCQERQSDGLVSMFNHNIGGSIDEGTPRRRLASNRVAADQTKRDLFQQLP